MLLISNEKCYLITTHLCCWTNCLASSRSLEDKNKFAGFVTKKYNILLVLNLKYKIKFLYAKLQKLS